MSVMSRPECAPDDPAPEAAGEFLGRVRTRLVAASLLGGAVFAALVNEAARWSAAAAVVYLGWKVPVLGFLGLFFLAALVFPVLRRWSPAATAARTDARLGLHDRLASWVDFRGRPEIPEAIRRAQACETARALAGVTPAAAAPIPPWLAAGPVLLVACLFYQFFIPVEESGFSPLVRVIVPARRIAPPGEVTPLGESGAPSGEQAGPARAPGKPSALAEKEKPPGKESDDEKSKVNPPEGVEGTARTKLADGDSRKSGDQAKPGDDGPGKGREMAREPSHIESERVGTKLARVVDPLYRPGGTQAAAAIPGGVATFHLLPQSGSAGAGGGPGGEPVVPEPVRIDLDAVPAPYRPIVKAYFDQLARAASPAGGIQNPEPARSPP
jgi:hypothetical protein